MVVLWRNSAVWIRIEDTFIHETIINLGRILVNFMILRLHAMHS